MMTTISFDDLTGLAAKGDKYDKIQDLVNQVNVSDISSIKQSVHAIVRVINDPSASVGELKSVILMDPPLAARVLKTANSAYYSRSFTRSFSDIEQAIIWMGTEIIRELALSQKVCEIFDHEQEYDVYSRRALWRHSIAVAVMAKAIYRKEFGLKGENAYVAGLLHDIGIIAQDQFLRESFVQILNKAREKSIDVTEAEREVLGFNHAEVGAAICTSWGLPDELAAAVRGHNNFLKVSDSHLKIAATLYLADWVCQANGFGFGLVPPQNLELYNKALGATEIKPYAIDLIFKSVKKELLEMEDKGLI